MLCREISIKGKGAIPFVQLKTQDFYFLVFEQLSLRLIDNCTSDSVYLPLFGDFPGVCDSDKKEKEKEEHSLS